MQDTNIVSLKKKLDVSELAGEKVMIDFESGKYYMLKGVGNDIWNMIQSEISLGKIIEQLLGEYDIDEKTCRESVIEFLDKMKENGFIEVK